jgi:nucleoside-diphosphate-sugar epimerase
MNSGYYIISLCFRIDHLKEKGPLTLQSVNRKVLITGGAGYVGSKLVPLLLENKFKVRVYDTFWYGNQVSSNKINYDHLELIKGDIRNHEKLDEALNGCTDVIHLACISNDPSYDLDPKLGEDINFNSFSPLVKNAIKNGVSRFIYASSSSVYGVKEEEQVTEKLSLNPLTDYSKFKAKCEPILLEKSSNNFVTTVVRPATVCGYAPRQRLDLSVNILTNHAVNERLIRIFGGDQFRPNLHIDDMCRAYVSLLSQPEDLINGEIFNIGAENMSIRDISRIVAEEVGEPLEIRIEDTPDNRSYRVSSDYIKEKIGFEPFFKVRDAVRDLITAFRKGLLPNSLSDKKYFNLQRMQQVITEKNV